MLNTVPILAAFSNVIIPVFVIVAIGYVVGRFHTIDIKSFSTVVLYAFSPALIITSLYNTTIAWDDLMRILMFIVLYMLGVVTLGWLVARLLGMDRGWEAAFILSTAFANVGNFGLPMVMFAFGQEGLKYATIVLVSLGIPTHMLGLFFATRERFTPRQAVAQIFRMPHIYATGISIVLNLLHVALPDAISRPMQLLGTAAVPLQVLMLGMQMAPITSWGQNGLTLPLLTWAILTRLVGGALIAFLAADLVGLTGVARQAVIVQTAMPTAVTASLLAVQFNNRPAFVTSVVLFSTLASMVTLTIVLGVLL